MNTGYGARDCLDLRHETIVLEADRQIQTSRNDPKRYSPIHSELDVLDRAPLDDLRLKPDILNLLRDPRFIPPPSVLVDEFLVVLYHAPLGKERDLDALDAQLL